MLDWRPTKNGMSHFDGVCLTRARFTSSSPVLLQRNGAPNTRMHNDEAISLFLNVHEFPLFCMGNVPNLFYFFDLGEAEQNYYLQRQNIELNCNYNWKSQDGYERCNDVSQ